MVHLMVVKIRYSDMYFVYTVYIHIYANLSWIIIYTFFFYIFSILILIFLLLCVFLRLSPVVGQIKETNVQL